MKNIRLLLGLLITFVLFGCTSLQDKELSSQKEVIHSFFIAEDNIYAIGQLNSYHFAGSEYSETGDLIRILRSPYVKNISSVKIHSIAKDVEKNKVKATLTLYFNDKELTQKLKINGIPTYMIFHKGELVWRTEALQPSTNLISAIKPFIEL